MNIPNQLRPLSEKGESFIRESALAFASMANGSASSKTNDEIAWDIFNQKIDKNKFKYLTHVGDLALPSPIRHHSIIRSPLNLLISQQARRPFVGSVIVCDEASIKEKFKNKFTFTIKEIQKRLKAQMGEFEIAYKKLLKTEQQIQQQLQAEPQNEQEAQVQQQLLAQMEEIEVALKQMKEEFQERLTLGQQELSKIDEYMTYEYKEIKEMLAQKGLKKIRQKHDAVEHRTSYFTDKIVTGKGYFYVDYIPGEKSIRYEALNSMQVHYPSIQGVRYVEDGPWVILEDWISNGQLIDEHGDAKELTDEVIKKLEYFKDYSSGQDVGQPNANVYTGARSKESGINRKRMWWLSPRKVFIKHVPNKHKEGTYFRHFINDEKQFAASMKIDKNKGEKLVTRYIHDLYTATVVDNQYVVDGRRIDIPLRTLDNLSRTQLPVMGRAYSSFAEEPYSLVWSTKDLQEMYDVVNFHRELYIAAAGVKGQVVDLSQKPNKMSVQEMKYHRKLGMQLIETVDKAGRKINSSYNQWHSFDDTLSPAIQYLEAVMQSLKDAVRETIGVSRQRMGQTVNSDQVGTSEMARDQSALITEILFYESDVVEARALRRALNLMCKHLWDKETLLQYTNKDLTTEIIKIPANLLNKADYDIIVMNNTDDERDMQELKQLAHRQHEKNMLSFKNIVEMYNKESLVDLQKSVIRWTDEAERLLQLNQQNAQQAQQQAEQAKIQMEAELKAMAEKDKMQLEQMKLQLDGQKMQMDQEHNNNTLMLKDKELGQKKELEMLKILSNRNVEMDYLQESSRSNQTNEQLQALQLQLQAIQMQIDAELGKNDAQLRDKEISAKKEIEGKKMRDKNRIKN